MEGVRYPDVRVRLVGEDGNAFAIIGRIRAALRRAGVPASEIEDFTAQATAGNYDDLLMTCMKWVQVD